MAAITAMAVLTDLTGAAGGAVMEGITADGAGAAMMAIGAEAAILAGMIGGETEIVTEMAVEIEIVMEIAAIDATTIRE